MNIRDFIAKQNWVFAKTYAKSAPHEYIVLSKVLGDNSKEEFLEFAKIIRDHGFPARFFSRHNTYFYIDGYFYWTMDERVEDTDLINRCKTEDYDLSFYPNILKNKGEKSYITMSMK